jgi:caa(3)-type oxidase subunit IV
VLEIFMHLRYESKVFRYMFISAILIMGVFMGLTLVDYIYR